MEIRTPIFAVAFAATLVSSAMADTAVATKWRLIGQGTERLHGARRERTLNGGLRQSRSGIAIDERQAWRLHRIDPLRFRTEHGVLRDDGPLVLHDCALSRGLVWPLLKRATCRRQHREIVVAPQGQFVGIGVAHVGAIDAGGARTFPACGNGSFDGRAHRLRTKPRPCRRGGCAPSPRRHDPTQRPARKRGSPRPARGRGIRHDEWLRPDCGLMAWPARSAVSPPTARRSTAMTTGRNITKTKPISHACKPASCDWPAIIPIR